jgi:RHS repeat-associated protein
VEVYFDDFKVEHIKSAVVQTEDYYPFGLNYNSYAKENSVGQDFLYNGKEEQDELGLGWLDYAARMYMPELGRWGAIDYLSEKFNSHSPYSYVLDNPISSFDPDGNDVYLIVWFTAKGEIGHVGVAVDNYKKEDVKDKNGNVVKDKNGNAVTREVADGTVTYYDFYARYGAGPGTHDEDREGQINKVENVKVEDLGRIDLGTGQDRPANGVIRMTAGANMTQHIAHEKEKMYQQQEKGNPTTYNGEKFNCSDFAKVGLNEMPGFYRLSGSENVNFSPNRWLMVDYNKNVTTPNYLFRSVRSIIQAGPAKGSVLKQTGNPDRDYVNAYTNDEIKDRTPNH